MDEILQVVLPMRLPKVIAFTVFSMVRNSANLCWLARKQMSLLKLIGQIHSAASSTCFGTSDELYQQRSAGQTSQMKAATESFTGRKSAQFSKTVKCKCRT